MGCRHAPALVRSNNREQLPQMPRNGPESNGSGGAFALAVALLGLGLAAGCGRNPESVAEATAYTDPGFVEVDGWRLHYALTATQDLPSAIAGSYGIVQGPNLALLVIALEASPSREAADAVVEATAVRLTGERKSLALARRDQEGRPTWLATVDVRHRVPITIEIEARATAAGPSLRARLTRDFRFE